MTNLLSFIWVVCFTTRTCIFCWNKSSKLFLLLLSFMFSLPSPCTTFYLHLGTHRPGVVGLIVFDDYLELIGLSSLPVDLSL